MSSRLSVFRIRCPKSNNTNVHWLLLATLPLGKQQVEISGTLSPEYAAMGMLSSIFGLPLMRNASQENVLSNYVEGLAASGAEAEHGEVIVE